MDRPVVSKDSNCRLELRGSPTCPCQSRRGRKVVSVYTPVAVITHDLAFVTARQHLGNCEKAAEFDFNVKQHNLEPSYWNVQPEIRLAGHRQA